MHDTVMSRIFIPFSTRTRSIAPRIAPVSPMTVATCPNDPGRCGRRTRMTMLYDADGCTMAAPSADEGTSSSGAEDEPATCSVITSPIDSSAACRSRETSTLAHAPSFGTEWRAAER
jgi:hypothetical protein